MKTKGFEMRTTRSVGGRKRATPDTKEADDNPFAGEEHRRGSGRATAGYEGGRGKETAGVGIIEVMSVDTTHQLFSQDGSMLYEHAND